MNVERIMSTLVWSPQMELGIPGMDSAHQAFFAELAHIAAAPDDQFGALFFLLIAKLERDFEEEEELMERIDFPALNSHREQHARVLSGLHHVVPHVMNGNIGIGRHAIELLQEWFLFHLTTMDLALAVALDMNPGRGDLAASPTISPKPEPPQNRAAG
ncbi:bacteriohemerythrin [Noviherbaspirillum sp. UKPF54]|uniref:bacteriohemerythrin n=1 Tax=Noviherbaspirillum sp. UKPF54 TaxID=2601898 RepID=UPI00352A8B23